MIRDELRYLRDSLKSMTSLERTMYIILAAMTIIVILSVGGLINIAPIHGALKLALFVVAVVIIAGFVVGIYYHTRTREGEDQDAVGTENKMTVNIPPIPSSPPTISAQKVCTPENDTIKDGQDTERSDNHYSGEPTATLSTFARQRIARQLPTLKHSAAILEKRKTAWVLLLQLEIRQPTGKTKRAWWARKAHIELEPRSTIIAEILWLLASLIVLALIVWTMLSSTSGSVSVLNLTASVIVALLTLRCSIALYNKWAYWYYWRLILFDSNPSEKVDAKAVIIDKPLLIPGGSVPSVDLRVVRLVSSSTARTQYDERSLRSILAGWLRIEWLLVDTYGQGDVRFNWMGPFRNTPDLVAQIDQARRKARLEEQ